MKKQITLELKPDQIRDNLLIRKIAARYCHVREDEITGIDYIKRSLDCRSRKPKYTLLVYVYANEPYPGTIGIKSQYPDINEKNSVIIVGAGPAGYFAALELLEAGIKPIIFERGKDVRNRRFDLKQILQKGEVDPNSNYCFGEGGAGAYSDGKLYTRSDKRGNIKKVLQVLVEHGADADIMIDAQPHIGSDKLPLIISAIRQTILDHGGEIHFNSLVTDLKIKDDRVLGVIVNNTDEHLADAVILATGHSARDIYKLFDQKKIFIEGKPFAVGFRVEHSQELINEIQYGTGYDASLPAASYKLVTQTERGGVFSFCVCPGGIIVPAATSSGELVVNGMSMSGRDSKFANSGIVTTVDSRDFTKYESFGALSGMKFQEELENKFYTGDKENLLKAPAQRLTDFVSDRKSTSLYQTSYIPGLIISEMKRLFPENITASLQQGLNDFGRKMRGFMTSEANIIGLESRTSSPVRITRDRESFSHVQIKNLYPCGEGSGYAGGIVSSAMDGQNAAKSLIKTLNN